MPAMPHPFKVVLDDFTAKGLSEAAALLRSTQSNYRIGVGNVAATLLERLVAEHPDLVVEILGIGGNEDTRLEKAAHEKPSTKKAKASKRAKVA